MKERNIVLLASALFLIVALVGGFVVGSIYLVIGSVVCLLLLPVWNKIFQKVDPEQSSS